MRSPPALSDTFRSAPNLPRASRHSGLRRIVLGEDVVQIEDLAADPVYQEGEAHRVIEAAGAHSYLGVALRLEGKLLGAILAHIRKRCGRFPISRSRCCKTSRRRR